MSHYLMRDDFFAQRSSWMTKATENFDMLNKGARCVHVLFFSCNVPPSERYFYFTSQRGRAAGC